MAKIKSEEVEKTEVKVDKVVETDNTQAQMLSELMQQMKDFKDMQTQFMQEKKTFENDKKEFKQTQANAPTAGNEFVEVICNIPKFEIDDLGAYDLGTRNSGNFKKMPKYGSKVNIQFSELQEIAGYPQNGLQIGSILINKKHQSAINDLGLQYIYENIVYPEDMDTFLDKSTEEIKKVMAGCPERMKEAFIAVIRKKDSEGTIEWKMNKLHAIEAILDIRI
ncbi:MAG TPA: hypothetical protein VIM70_07970 [Clostridium sp.]|uniref:hypothetical protein n=1 Tax=Clostridium sp. TaxID=1506 RepID=UPI002F9260E9